MGRWIVKKFFWVFAWFVGIALLAVITYSQDVQIKEASSQEASVK